MSVKSYTGNVTQENLNCYFRFLGNCTGKGEGGEETGTLLTVKDYLFLR